MHDRPASALRGLATAPASSAGYGLPVAAIEQARRLADRELLTRLSDLVRQSAELTAAIVIHLSEVDARRLFLAEGYSSLFAYCTGALGLSESATYKRIQVVRLCRRLPGVLAAVQSGQVHLSGLCVVAPLLTEGNHREVLARAAGHTKREIEALAEALRAAQAARPPVPAEAAPSPGKVTGDLFAHVRVPTPSADGAADRCGGAASSRSGASADDRAEAPVAGGAAEASLAANPAERAGSGPAPQSDRAAAHSRERRLSVVLTPRLIDRLGRARALLWHALPGADTAQVIERALDVLVATLEKKRFGVGARPRRTTHEALPRPQRELAPTTTAEAAHPLLSSDPGAAAESSMPCEPDAGPRAAPMRRPVAMSVRRAVFLRDSGRCTFVGPTGHRCAETRGLELHHRLAHGRQGPDSVANLTLHCRGHNALEARRDFGEGHIAARIQERRSDE